MPDALEYHPGYAYYFISTSSPDNLNSKDGGYCRENNIKLVFKIADKGPVLTSEARDGTLKNSGNNENERIRGIAKESESKIIKDDKSDISENSEHQSSQINKIYQISGSINNSEGFIQTLIFLISVIYSLSETILDKGI